MQSQEKTFKYSYKRIIYKKKDLERSQQQLPPGALYSKVRALQQYQGNRENLKNQMNLCEKEFANSGEKNSPLTERNIPAELASEKLQNLCLVST